MTLPIIVALIVAAVIGGMGLTIKGQHAINRAVTVERDTAKTANKLLADDCRQKIAALSGQIIDLGRADQARIVAANRARSAAKARSAQELPTISGLIGIVRDPATMPEAQECSAVRQILREYARDATK